jgi:hypothetical protein
MRKKYNKSIPSYSLLVINKSEVLSAVLILNINNKNYDIFYNYKRNKLIFKRETGSFIEVENVSLDLSNINKLKNKIFNYEIFK